MIAEIYHKISSSGSNLTERLEDNLTGNFFGTLRYIPFNQGMKRILAEFIYPHELASIFQKIDVDFWDENIEFWPYHKEGELDVLLTFPDVIIGIEGYSSDVGSKNKTSEQ